MEKLETLSSNSWCQCDQGRSCRLLCSCGEQEDAAVEWGWDGGKNPDTVVVLQNNTEVMFQPTGSSGTAAVAGNSVLAPGCHHYWEVRMLGRIGGTDTMVGAGTGKVNLTSHPTEFASLLGKCGDSWGYSYTGFVHHGGKKWRYGPKWGRGAILGVHLDSWRGTLEFYLNRKPLGIAFKGLKSREMYPMLSSTLAQTGMRLICAQSFPSSLQFSCLKLLARTSSRTSTMPSVLHDLQLPPGLQTIVNNNYWFLVGQQVEEDGVDYIDTPPVSSELRLPARARTANDSVKPLSGDIRRGIFHFVHDNSVPAITKLNGTSRTGSRKRKRVSLPLAENKCENSLQDSDDEECFLCIQSGNSKKLPKLNRSRSSLSTLSVTSNYDGRAKIEMLLSDKSTVKDSDSNAIRRIDNETCDKKVIKKRFTLRRQK